MVVSNTEKRSGHFLQRKERLTQWYPLAMIAYSIGVIPLFRELQDAHPRITQPWYVYDTGLGGKYGSILTRFQDLQAREPLWGYFP